MLDRLLWKMSKEPFMSEEEIDYYLKRFKKRNRPYNYNDLDDYYTPNENFDDNFRRD